MFLFFFLFFFLNIKHRYVLVDVKTKSKNWTKCPFLHVFARIHTGRKKMGINPRRRFASISISLPPPFPLSMLFPLVNCRNLITNGSKFSWNCPLTAFITAIPCYRKMTRAKLLDPKSQWKVQRVWYRTCMQVGKWRHSCANLARSQLFLTATLNVLTRTSPFVRS